MVGEGNVSKRRAHGRESGGSRLRGLVCKVRFKAQLDFQVNKYQRRLKIQEENWWRLRVRIKNNMLKGRDMHLDNRQSIID